MVGRLNNHIEAVDNFSHLPESLKTKVECLTFKRHGGLSPAPFNSLNACYKTGDRYENVVENRKRISSYVGVHNIISANQIHGCNLIHVNSETYNYEKIEADGLFTSIPRTSIFIKQADCQAVTLYDPEAQVIGNIHCGWKGSVLGIIPRAVHEMVKIYGSRPADLWASISPSLGKCCSEFRGWEELLPAHFKKFKDKKDHINFKTISIHQLAESGVPIKHIDCSDICTKCDSDFFSYRRSKKTGRFVTLATLK